jgi:homoserine O-acetyltransferase/O-succinyltransferase
MPIDYSSPPPASGAWREGDAVGNRKFATFKNFKLENGFIFEEVTVAYETWGELNQNKSNAIYVAHALTGDSHLSGKAEEGHLTPGWWDGLIGEGKAVDPEEWFVVCANVLGGCQGTTGPASLAPDKKPWGSRFPRITVNDQVRLEKMLADHLGIEKFAMIMGGSMGGMRVLEWAVEFPDKLDTAFVIATSAAASADQIATQSAQIDAIQSDLNWNNGDYYDKAPGSGPHVGLGLARKFAHLTYRSEAELDSRFGRSPQNEGSSLFAVESYLAHHANKLARRFDANSYIVLTDAMSTFDVGKNRGGIAKALSGIKANFFIAGVDTDRLYPIRQQHELAHLIPTAHSLAVVKSEYGHDGFLLEFEQVSSIVEKAIIELRKRIN